MMTVVSSLRDVKHFVHVRIRLDGVEQRRNGGAQHRQTAGDHPCSEHTATTGSIDDGSSLLTSPRRAKCTWTARYNMNCARDKINAVTSQVNVCDFNCHKIIKCNIII